MKLINGIKNIFKSFLQLFGKRSNYEVEMLSGIDVDALLKDPNAQETIYNKQKEIKDTKGRLEPEYDTITDNLASVQRINDLSRKDIQQLETISKLYSNTLIEKDYYKHQVSTENKQVSYLEAYKEQIPKAIEKITEFEENQRLVKRDLDYLEGEKGDIYYKNNRLKNSLAFIKYFIIGLAVAAAIAAFILVTMTSVYSHDIFIPAIVIVVILLFLGTWIYVFRRYALHEMKKNNLLQKRLVTLMNKTKIKYVNNQQFLDYEYKKYQVNSSEMLILRWENYQSNVRNKNKFKNISNNLTALISDLEAIFPNSKEIETEFVVENIDYFMSKKSRKTLQNNLEQERKRIKEEIKKLDNDQKMLTKLLTKIDTHQ